MRISLGKNPNKDWGNERDIKEILIFYYFLRYILSLVYRASGIRVSGDEVNRVF